LQEGTLDSGDSIRFCFGTADAGTTVKATLVYNDSPGSPTAGHILVNDLDLAIIDQTGREWRTTTTNDGEFDSTNNVEQVLMTNVASGTYAVHIYGSNVPVSNQPFAVAVTGQILFADCTSFDLNDPVCPLSCSGQGTCLDTGFCQCNTGFTGLDCSLSPCSTTANVVCNGNGYCDYESASCVCGLNFAPPDCAGQLPPAATNNTVQNITVNKHGVSKGLLAGAVIAAFFIGAIFSIFLGGFLAVKYLEYRRDKAQKDRITKEEEMR